jgi:hypothetical protein
MRKLALIILVLAATANAGVIFNLDPTDGALAGAAGTSVGWGYNISNDTDYIFIQSFYVSSSTTNIGSFVPQNFLTAAAYNGNPLIGTWSQGSDGLQFDISPSAILNASERLTIRLVYDTWDGPDMNTATQLSWADEVDATVASYDNQAEVLVNAEYAGPEPGAYLLLGSGLALLLVGRRLHRPRG